jgi:hypothetical protein
MKDIDHAINAFSKDRAARQEQSKILVESVGWRQWPFLGGDCGSEEVYLF